MDVLRRRQLVEWLRRYNGAEVLDERVLDQLFTFDVLYDKTYNRLLCDGRTAFAGVKTRDELVASLPPGATMTFRDQDFRAVHATDLARTVAWLVNDRDPLKDIEHVIVGTHERYAHCVKAIEMGAV